jgi:Ca2+/Na+ antiporter
VSFITIYLIMFDKKNYQHEKNAMKQQNKHNNNNRKSKEKKLGMFDYSFMMIKIFFLIKLYRVFGLH